MPSTRILPGEPGYPVLLSVLGEPKGKPTTAPSTAALPPLYVRGTLPDRAGVAIVGTRSPSDPARAFARDLVHDLAAEGFCIWSGGALGIDTVAHEAALDAGAPTVVVMGGGLDRPYPLENVPLFERVLARGGALVARVADQVPPNPPGFIRRNEILAAATAATVVVQAGFKSGARSTASAARRLGRPLCVVPHAPWDALGAGCALELVLGAHPVTCAADVRAAIDSPLPQRPPPRRRSIAKARLFPALSAPHAAHTPHVAHVDPPSSGCELSPEERVILRVLGESAVHIDEVCEAVGLPLPDVVAVLLTLTLQAVVVEGPAGYYRRTGSA